MSLDDDDKPENMDNALNYYQILGLAERRKDSTISTDDLRHAYKRALLYYHPDKNGACGIRATGQVPTVDEISHAYKILQDPKARVQYDSKLRLQNEDGRGNIATRHTGIETVDLDDLNFDENSNIWTRPCRCGSDPAFVIAEPELEKNAEFGELVSGCKGCSLWLKVLFTMEE